MLQVSAGFNSFPGFYFPVSSLLRSIVPSFHRPAGIPTTTMDGPSSSAATPSSITHGAHDKSRSFLPAVCLAGVLDYMWYGDVRQCMLAGKVMAVEAAKNVATLNITKASELDVAAARRFENASEVNVLSLVSRLNLAELTEEEKEDYDSMDLISQMFFRPQEISIDTVAQVVPFLSSLPKLMCVFVSGLCEHRSGEVPTEMVYSFSEYNKYEHAVRPRDHGKVFATLVKSFTGGFRSRSLKQNLVLKGIDTHQLPCVRDRILSAQSDGDLNTRSPCYCCLGAISSFPLCFVMRSIQDPKAFCLPIKERVSAVLGRIRGDETAFRSEAGFGMLLGYMDNIIPTVEWLSGESDTDKAFAREMKSQGALVGFYNKRDDCYIKWARPSSPSGNAFQDLIVLMHGLRGAVKDIPRSSILQVDAFSQCDLDKTVYDRQTFEAIVATGLNLNPSDYIIIDAEKEPALQRPQGHELPLRIVGGV